MPKREPPHFQNENIPHRSRNEGDPTHSHANPEIGRIGPLGDIYEMRNWLLKGNDMAHAKMVPLLSPFSIFANWAGEMERRFKSLCYRPVSDRMDYAVKNLREILRVMSCIKVLTIT